MALRLICRLMLALVPESLVPQSLPLRDHRERGHGAQLLGFVDDYIQMLKDVGDGHGVDFAAGVVAFFNKLLQIAAGNLHG